MIEFDLNPVAHCRICRQALFSTSANHECPEGVGYSWRSYHKRMLGFQRAIHTATFTKQFLDDQYRRTPYEIAIEKFLKSRYNDNYITAVRFEEQCSGTWIKITFLTWQLPEAVQHAAPQQAQL